MKHISTEEEIKCHGCPNTHVNTPAGEAFESLWLEKCGSKPHRNHQAPHFSSREVRIKFHKFETSLKDGTSSGGPR